MQYRHQFSILLVVTIIGVLLVKGAHASKPLALRMIMQDMYKSLEVIQYGIADKDWRLVAENAQLIANHPQPPLAEKLRILRYVGSDVSRFKELDKNTRQAARKLRSAAASQNGPEVISEFAVMENSCLACHQSLRKLFKDNFYE